jgi:phosphoglucomutase
MECVEHEFFVLCGGGAVCNRYPTEKSVFWASSSLLHHIFNIHPNFDLCVTSVSMCAAYNVSRVATKAFDDQAPGTSGLRKTTKHFTQPHYLENFVQAIFNSLPADEFKGQTLVVSGDGRYFTKQAGQIIIKMAAANGFGKVVAGINFWMSTPAVSSVIRDLKAYGGIIMTASHNPGGPDADFGVKYNIGNGGAAPEKVTDAIYANTKKITEYLIADFPDVDATVKGVTKIGDFSVEIVDTTLTHINLLKSIFDFPALKAFVARPDFKLVFDGMHGIAGPTARAVFIDELGVPAENIKNSVPLEDFGGGHPDPNLTYAHDLVDTMGLGHNHDVKDEDVPDFGAACDGDADRNMILGKKFFVTPSDSVAIIAANATAAIPYFKQKGLTGIARSMPTSAAADRVAAKLGLGFYEVPTGWKFFGNLLDAGKIAICGEESFGTGSDHIREKDGMWAILAWLQILQYKNSLQPAGSKLVSVEDVVKDHWKTYGRNYYTRYDYEAVDKDAAVRMFDRMRGLISEGKVDTSSSGYEVKTADDFTYEDPVDGSVSKKQGIRLIFTDGSRVIYRMSGTGSVGATIRVYIEQYQADETKLGQDPQDALLKLVQLALSFSQLKDFTGRDAPTVIT